MRKILKFAFVLAILPGAALAQQAGTGTQGQNSQFNNPQFRAQMQKYQPVLDLVTEVGILPDLEKDKSTALSKAQAQKLIPVLKDLSTRKDLKPADADKILTNIETKILSAAQLKQLDKIQIDREKQAAARRAAFQNGQRPSGTGTGGNFGGFPGGNNANGANGQRPQGANGTQGQNGQRPGGARGGMFAAIQNGTPYNPFTQPREAQILKDYLAVLAKK